MDVGYALLLEYWGHGWAEEALAAVVEVGFEQLGADSIYGECDVQNAASMRPMEKVSFQRLATVDYCEVVYAIRRDAWRGLPGGLPVTRRLCNR